MDLCLDSIQIMNRIPKMGKEESPYELFTRKEMDYLRDLRADWGEPVIVKKPKGIASDLKVTGQWAVVVRRIMNGTGVLKVYLIQTKKYAYHLQFQRAIATVWVSDALEQVSQMQNIGFKDENAEIAKINIEENDQIVKLETFIDNDLDEVESEHQNNWMSPQWY